MGAQVTPEQVAEAVNLAAASGYGLVLEPGMLYAARAAAERGVELATWAGYPTGKHEGLVKAAEARLAVQHGAELVAYVPDVTRAGDSSAFMSELITVRESVPHPARLAVVLDSSVLKAAPLAQATAWACRCGVDAIVTGLKHSDPEGVATIVAAAGGVEVIGVDTQENVASLPANSFWVVL